MSFLSRTKKIQLSDFYFHFWMRAYELFDLDVNEVKRCKISFTKKIIKVKVARVVVFEKYKKLRISYFFELEMLDQSH